MKAESAKEWRLASLEDWDAIIEELLPELKKDSWIALYGEMGAGKTTFVQRLLKVLGVEGSVRSPSYPLMLDYELPDRRVYHLDAFRLDPRHEKPWNEELLQGQFVLVEWPERSGIPKDRFDFELCVEVLGDEGLERRAIWRRNFEED